MKTIGLLSGLAWALAASVGCGGTVVFEEDGGEGGAGAGSSQNGPISSSAITTSNGGNGPVSTVGTTVGPGPGPSSSTGVTGCGSLFEQFGFTAECNACMEGACCAELLACDVGTECYVCLFEGQCTDAANEAVNALFGVCYPNNCQPICEQQQPCGEDFQCFDGSCLSFEFVCDGVPDCFEGEDELCEENGICGSGVSVFDPGADSCLGDFCCDQFQECSSFGQDPESCQQCLQNGGGDLCDQAVDCALASPCFGDEQFFEICGGLSVGDEQVANCLNRNCCEVLEQCSGGPDGPDGCSQCFETGGQLCDPVIECYLANCDFRGGGGDPHPGG